MKRGCGIKGRSINSIKKLDQGCAEKCIKKIIMKKKNKQFPAFQRWQ